MHSFCVSIKTSFDPIIHNELQSTPVISKSKGPVYSFDITVYSL